MSVDIQAIGTLPANKQAIVTIAEKNRWLFRFQPVGAKSQGDHQSMNALLVFSDFNKQEQALLREVSKRIGDDRRLTLRQKDFSKAHWAKLKRAILLWKRKNLLKRIKRGTYMVNPWFLVPPLFEHDRAMNRWNSLP